MQRLVMTILASLAAVLAPSVALAYVGPGAGLSAVGSLLALFAALGLAIVGFVWYPIKRLLRYFRAQQQSPEHGE